MEFCPLLLILWFLTALVLPSLRAAEPSWTAAESTHYQSAYEEAKKQFDSETNHNNVDVSWKFSRACFEWADLASSDAQRAAIAEQGIAASRRAIRLDPKCAPAFYYLGLNLGQVARTKLLGALSMLDDMEAAWISSLTLDPHFDYAGAHRAIGILYRDAPGWPAGLGNRSKARQHLKKAVELSPEYPDNPLTWLEGLLKWGEKSAVSAQMNSTDEVLRQARLQLTGPGWTMSWRDWDKRWEKIKSQVSINPTSTPSLKR